MSYKYSYYLIIFFAVCAVIGFVWGKLDRKIKGIKGEKRVSNVLNRLNKNKYRVLNDVLIRVKDKTVQIDHIVVSVYGIFVIETKNYAGNIYGDGYKDKWTQYLGREKNSFQNPLRQNYGHYKTIENLLNLSDESLLKPVVAFAGTAKLKISNANNVVYLKNLYNYITYYTEEVIDINTVNRYCEILTQSNIESISENRQHVQRIRENLK